MYGFVQPGAADTYRLLLSVVTTEWMSRALAEWVQWADPNGRKRLVQVVDRAVWHTSGERVVPASVELFEPPPGTPDLQPAESAGPLVRGRWRTRCSTGWTYLWRSWSSAAGGLHDIRKTVRQEGRLA